jgi:protein NDRG1
LKNKYIKDTSFQEFIDCPEMKQLKDRIIWIHVDLPGQEPNATDLTAVKYPCLTDIAQELVHVLDHYNIGQITCFGEGLGANVAARFAMAHPNRCHGVVLIHPTGSSASFFETAKEKLSNLSPNKNKASHMEDYLIWHRYGNVRDLF